MSDRRDGRVVGYAVSVAFSVLAHNGRDSPQTSRLHTALRAYNARVFSEVTANADMKHCAMHNMIQIRFAHL